MSETKLRLTELLKLAVFNGLPGKLQAAEGMLGAMDEVVVLGGTTFGGEEVTPGGKIGFTGEALIALIS